MIPESVKSLIVQFPLGFVATVTPDGRPAVSPKGTFLVLDESTIGFGNIRSPGTLANLKRNPACEVNFIDVLSRKGARLAGTARIIQRDASEFEGLIGKWKDVWGDLAGRITDLVLINVDRVKPYRTPPYDDGATEEDMIALYKSKFAAMYT